MLLPITLNELPERIQEARPYIEKCLKRSPIPHTFSDVVSAIISHKFKMFMLAEDGVVKGVALLDVYSDLGKKVMNIWLMSHDDGYSKEAEDYRQLEGLAKSLGVQYILYYGRRGFYKTKSKYGWKVSQVVMTKEVI